MSSRAYHLVAKPLELHDVGCEHYARHTWPVEHNIWLVLRISLPGLSALSTHLNKPETVRIHHDAHLVVPSCQLQGDSGARLHVFVTSESGSNDEDML